jgi:hypothetical protein
MRKELTFLSFLFGRTDQRSPRSGTQCVVRPTRIRKKTHFLFSLFCTSRATISLSFLLYGPAGRKEKKKCCCCGLLCSGTKTLATTGAPRLSTMWVMTGRGFLSSLYLSASHIDPQTWIPTPRSMPHKLISAWTTTGVGKREAHKEMETETAISVNFHFFVTAFGCQAAITS